MTPEQLQSMTIRDARNLACGTQSQADSLVHALTEAALDYACGKPRPALPELITLLSSVRDAILTKLVDTEAILRNLST
jgi:hypothetical protein